MNIFKQHCGTGWPDPTRFLKTNIIALLTAKNSLNTTCILPALFPNMIPLTTS